MIQFNGYIFCFIIPLICSCGCQQISKTNAAIEKTKNTDSSQAASDNVYWLQPKQCTPLGFIKALTKGKNKNAGNDVTTAFADFPRGWVKRADIDSLMPLITSKEKCNCIVNPVSSIIPSGSSDVGDYAIVLLIHSGIKKG